jgi:hypothetical protein
MKLNTQFGQLHERIEKSKANFIEAQKNGFRKEEGANDKSAANNKTSPQKEKSKNTVTWAAQIAELVT